MLKYLSVSMLFFFSSAIANCPAPKNTFSMIYPAKILFISEDPQSKEPELIPSTIAIKILSELKMESPKIIFSGTAQTFSLLQKKVVKK